MPYGHQRSAKTNALCVVCCVFMCCLFVCLCVVCVCVCLCVSVCLFVHSFVRSFVCLFLLAALTREAEACARSTQTLLDLQHLVLASPSTLLRSRVFKRCTAGCDQLAMVEGHPHKLHIALPLPGHPPAALETLLSSPITLDTQATPFRTGVVSSSSEHVAQLAELPDAFVLPLLEFHEFRTHSVLEPWWRDASHRQAAHPSGFSQQVLPHADPPPLLWQRMFWTIPASLDIASGASARISCVIRSGSCARGSSCFARAVTCDSR